VTAIGRKRSSSRTIRFEEPEEEEIDEAFFVPGVTPSLGEYGPHDIYLTMNAAELCVALLFDDRKRQEANSLLFIHVLYKNDLLERIISDTSRVFFCALKVVDITKANSEMDVNSVNEGLNGQAECHVKESEFEDDISMTDEERYIYICVNIHIYVNIDT
jgi:hypothetical protein